MKSSLVVLSIFFLSLEYSKYQETHAILTGDYVGDIESAGFMVNIHIKRGDEDFLCGGVIYSNNKFATCAHCLYNITSATVSMGSLDPFEDDDGESISFELDEDEYIRHPDWVPGLYDHDIAVGYTPMPLEFGDPLNKIKVVDEHFVVNESVTIAAYGYGSSYENAVNNLRWTVTGIMNFQSCSNIYSRNNDHVLDGNIHFCLAPIPNHINHIYSGDSGGPIIELQRGKLVGIIAASAFGKPDVAVKVAPYRSFLANPRAFVASRG